MSGQRLLVADDHPLIREGLQLAVRARLPGHVVDTAESVDRAEKLAQQHRHYDLVLLDYQLPDALGFSGFFRLQHVLGSVPIAIISAHGSAHLIAAAKAVGAAGFLSKAQPFDELADSIVQLLQGKTAFPRDTRIDGFAELKDRLDTLSPAQKRVLAALVRGHLNKQIAGDLDVSEATVKAHLTAIFRKLGVHNRVQAILIAKPLLDPDGEA